MAKALNLLTGIGLGAGLAYLLDPDLGWRRRALIRDQFAGALPDCCKTVHQRSEDISALQGGLPQYGEPTELLQEHWSPSTRAVAGTTGCVLMTNCLARRTPGAILLGTFGFGLFLRALTNLETRRLFGFAPGRRGIDVHKTINIDAPIERVYALLADPENYPRFTDTVREVRQIAPNRYHKAIAGPGGVEVKLDEIITQRVPNELFAWRSGPNSAVKYAGMLRFFQLDPHRTQVQLTATYNPPGGVLAHSAAWLAGWDPKSQASEALMRAKSMLETGKQPHDAAQKDSVPLAQ